MSHLWEARFKWVNKENELAKPFTAVNGVEPTRGFPAGSAPLALHLCARLYKQKIEFVMGGFIVILYHALLLR